MNEVRLRFAPSPTGYLHIGGLRTALYNYLFAKKNGGKLILRIEDTDQSRFVEGALENLIDAMNWAGIEFDEGVFVKNGEIVQVGDYGPYIQSERLDIYGEYIDKLIESGHAYYCFCSKERLDSVREGQKAQGLVPKYDGFCRNVSTEDAKARIEKGEEYVVRLKLPHDYDIKFHDLVRGDITINTNDVDDQVLLKSDGYPTYHMAVVVDDHLMKISHIVRGEEWLPSTPKHVYLYEAFGWEKPVYVHLPTVLNKERKKLSKREGDVAVGDFKEKGYLPQGLVNYLALVGWSPEDNEEIFPMDDLIEQFSFERVSKTGGIFDVDKLDWVNAHYIKDCQLGDLTDKLIPYLIDAEFIDEKFAEDNREWLELLTETVRDSLHNLSEVVDKVRFVFEDEFEIASEEEIAIINEEDAETVLDGIEAELENTDEIDMEYAKGLMKKVQKATGVKGKKLFMPARVGLTGTAHGPEFVNVLVLLGKEKILKRIRYVKDKYNIGK